MKKPKFITYDNKIRWHSDEAIDKKWKLARLQIQLRMTAGNGAMGRLGGGWSWKLGAMGSRNELCLEIIAFTLRFRLLPNKQVSHSGLTEKGNHEQD